MREAREAFGAVFANGMLFSEVPLAFRALFANGDPLLHLRRVVVVEAGEAEVGAVAGGEHSLMREEGQ